MMFPMIPAQPMDLVERLKYINAETERIKEAQLPQALERLMSMADSIPPSVIGAGSRMSKRALNAASTLFKLSRYKPRPDGFLLPALGINFIATNVPGVQVPQYLLGHSVPRADSAGAMRCDTRLQRRHPELQFNAMFWDERRSELDARCIVDEILR